MIDITINGKACTCEKGEYLLDVCRRNEIYLPTLCRHESVGEHGACRLCLAEVVENGRSKIVVSCIYPVERSCEVFTDSERVRKDRSVVLMLLKARAPESPEIEALCKTYGAMDGSRFAKLDGEKCIMCGLCARACASLGSGAISTVGRGTEKKVSTPYDELSPACIGCLSCVQICPTDAISFTENDRERTVWGKTFELVHCESCGEVIGTREELEYAAMRVIEAKKENGTYEEEDADSEKRVLCKACRRKAMTDVMAHTFGIK